MKRLLIVLAVALASTPAMAFKKAAAPETPAAAPASPAPAAPVEKKEDPAKSIAKPAAAPKASPKPAPVVQKKPAAAAVAEAEAKPTTKEAKDPLTLEYERMQREEARQKKAETALQKKIRELEGL